MTLYFSQTRGRNIEAIKRHYFKGTKFEFSSLSESCFKWDGGILLFLLNLLSPIPSKITPNNPPASFCGNNVLVTKVSNMNFWHQWKWGKTHLVFRRVSFLDVSFLLNLLYMWLVILNRFNTQFLTLYSSGETIKREKALSWQSECQELVY